MAKKDLSVPEVDENVEQVEAAPLDIAKLCEGIEGKGYVRVSPNIFVKGKSSVEFTGGLAPAPTQNQKFLVMTVTRVANYDDEVLPAMIEGDFSFLD